MPPRGLATVSRHRMDFRLLEKPASCVKSRRHAVERRGDIGEECRKRKGHAKAPPAMRMSRAMGGLWLDQFCRREPRAAHHDPLLHEGRFRRAIRAQLSWPSCFKSLHWRDLSGKCRTSCEVLQVRLPSFQPQWTGAPIPRPPRPALRQDRVCGGNGESMREVFAA